MSRRRYKHFDLIEDDGAVTIAFELPPKIASLIGGNFIGVRPRNQVPHTRALLSSKEMVVMLWEWFIPPDQHKGGPKALVSQSLVRMTMAESPRDEDGYISVMDAMVTKLMKLCHGNLLDMLLFLYFLESYGVRFNDFDALMCFVTSLKDALKNIEAPYEDLTPRSMDLSTDIARVQGFLIWLASTTKTFEQSNPVLKVDTIELLISMNPELLPLALEVFMALPNVKSFTDIFPADSDGQHVWVGEIWIVLLAAIGDNDITIRRVRQIVANAPSNAILLLIQLSMYEGIEDRHIVELLKFPEVIFDNMDSDSLMTLLLTWDTCGRPRSIKEFHDAGGTVDTWQAQLEQERVRALVTPVPVAPAKSLPKADQNPSGTKRHHHNFRAPADESVDIDFGALCSELNVSACFTELDEELVRTVLVYGLLQTGDRLATIATLPSRNDKKLWAQVRGHVSQSSRKPLIKALRPLIDAHLVSYIGGNYQLARKNPRFPQANILLTQLWGLVAKHTS